MENGNSGWSWGGFMFSPVVILASKRYVYLLLYLLMLVPFVNLIGWLVPMLVLAFKGRDLAMTSSAFANPDEARGFMKGIDHAGKIMFWLTLILVAIGIILGVVIGASLLSLIGGFAGGLGGGNTPAVPLNY